MNVSIDGFHPGQSTPPCDSRSEDPVADAARRSTVLSVHHTSQGLLRYRRWPGDQITVELLVPSDPAAPATAATWQICAVIDRLRGIARRRRNRPETLRRTAR